MLGTLMLALTLSRVFSYVVVLLAICGLVLLVFKVGGLLLRIVFGIIINSLLGLISIVILNAVFDLGIPIVTPVLVAVAVFGLPGVGTIAVLRLLHVPL